MDDMLWSSTAKRRPGQKARLSVMIPPMVRSLRAGAAAVKVSDEKIDSFLGVLYNLHMAAINPAEVKATPARVAPGMPGSSSEPKHKIENLHDFVADLVLGTWLAFDQDGSIKKSRLSWISPWRATLHLRQSLGLDPESVHARGVGLGNEHRESDADPRASTAVRTRNELNARVPRGPEGETEWRQAPDGRDGAAATGGQRGMRR
jgi:hypothetical protein